MAKKATALILLLVYILFGSNIQVFSVNAAALDYQSGNNASTSDLLTTVPAPQGITLKAGYKRVTATWNTVSGAARYYVYRSTTQGYGYTRVGEIPHNAWATTYQFTDINLTNQVNYYYVVTAVDAAGQESAYSNERDAMPHIPFTWAGKVLLKDPSTPSETYKTQITHIMGTSVPVIVNGEFHMNDPEDPSKSLTGRTDPEDPYTFKPVEGIIAQVGYGPASLPPVQWTNWEDASFFGGWAEMLPLPHTEEQKSPHDRYQAQFVPNLNQAEWLTDNDGKKYAEFEVVYRFSSSKGKEWIYGGIDWHLDPNYRENEDPKLEDKNLDNRGKLKVYEAPENSVPVLPAPPNLRVGTGENDVTSTTITLLWDGLEDTSSLYKYQVSRSQQPGGPYTVIGSTNADVTQFQDKNLIAGMTYYYVVCSLNYNLECGENSNTVAQATELRNVQVTFNVTVPSFTPGNTIYLSEIPADPTRPIAWKAKALNRVGTSQTFSAKFSMTEGMRYNFRVSRGEQGTVQTLADGNSPAYDPSFTVLGDINGEQTVKITVANWDDPLVLSYSPGHKSEATGFTTIQVFWNQPMPANTTFKVVALKNNAIIHGKFTQDTTGRILTFTPAQALAGGCDYKVTVSNQQDQSPQPVVQKLVKEWTFTVRPFQMYLPVTKR